MRIQTEKLSARKEKKTQSKTLPLLLFLLFRGVLFLIFPKKLSFPLGKISREAQVCVIRPSKFSLNAAVNNQYIREQREDFAG